VEPEETARFRDVEALRLWMISELKRLDDLREADNQAVRLAHEDLSKRLEGFPQQFATKDEMTNARETVQRLEKDQLSVEVYNTNHKQLEGVVNKLDRDKLPEAAFKTFVENYQREREEAAVERRSVAVALASTSARESGQTATWKQIGGVIAGIATLLGILTLVINYFVGG
jgi:transcription initiation factor TFIIIB Brf1 subunit/transcription initiation factor TFIIB